MQEELNKLDNPVWHSLNETHYNFAIDYKAIKFYQPDFCPFGGFEGSEDISQAIDNYAQLVDNFFIVGNKPEISTQVQLKKELVCLQMVVYDKIDLDIQEDIVAVNHEHTNDLFDLITKVQPGYFKKKTALLGNYFGIFKNGELIAVTGERMAMNDFVEVSAIVTHPEHTGNGYAKQLIAHTVNNIFLKNRTPFLHVTETNLGAICLYEKLGFTTRRKMSFWNIIK